MANLTVKQQARPGGAAPPKAPKGKPSKLGSELEIDGRGHLIHARSTDGQLPFLLGDLGSLFVNLLRSGNRYTWQQNAVCSFGESAPRRRPGLPAHFHVPRMTVPGLRPRLAPPAPPANVRKATERTVYQRGVAVGDTLTLTRHYELKAPPADDAPGVSLVLNGPITFDTRPGMPREAAFRGTFSLTSRAITARLPLKVSYKLLEGVERENVLHPPLPKLSGATR